MFADIGDFIGLFVFVLVAIVSMLFKKKEKQEEDFDLPPELKPRRPQPPPVAKSWEAELRRLLENRPPPPPVVRHAPPPTPVSAPPPIAPSPWAERESHAPVSPPARARHPESAAAFTAEGEMCEPDAQFAGATHLQERVAHHLADVTRHRVSSTQVQHRGASREAAHARELVRTPRGARAAIIASIILGPPKALEQ
jgi:hypothetical protein